MGVYHRFVLPSLIHLVMRNRMATRFRAELVPGATGRVLEIGIGSGLNLPFYAGSIQELHGIDPSTELLGMARQRAAAAPFPVTLRAASAEHLPFDDRSFDSV